MKKLNHFLIIIFLHSLFFHSLASDGREVIKAYESGKPAKLEIEVTKVRSDNYVDFSIDRLSKKIYRDISNTTKQDDDLERQLYVTTYLKPKNKSNTINDELPHKIINSDGKRYLEISYFEEPKNIYLWVVKNNKVEKLYTGVLKEINNSTRGPIVQDEKLDMFFNYKIGSPMTFNLSKDGDFSKVSSNDDNLVSYTGKMSKAWTTLYLKFVKFTITVDGESASYHIGNYGNYFEANYKGIHFAHSFNSNNNSANISFTPSSSFNTIVIRYEQSDSNAFNKDIYADTLTINGTKQSFYLSATSMDFGSFSKNSGATAESKVTIHEGGNLKYTISDLPNFISISKVNDPNSKINVFLNPTEIINNEFKIIGTINTPENGKEYTEGNYIGNFGITVTATENTIGGKF